MIVFLKGRKTQTTDIWGDHQRKVSMPLVTTQGSWFRGTVYFRHTVKEGFHFCRGQLIIKMSLCRARSGTVFLGSLCTSTWCETLSSALCPTTTSSALGMTTGRGCVAGNKGTKRFVLVLCSQVSPHLLLSPIGYYCPTLSRPSDLRRVRVLRRLWLCSWETLAADPFLLWTPLRVLVRQSVSHITNPVVVGNNTEFSRL